MPKPHSVSAKTQPLAEEVGDRVGGCWGLRGHEGLGRQAWKGPRALRTGHPLAVPIPVGSGGGVKGDPGKATMPKLRRPPGGSDPSAPCLAISCQQGIRSGSRCRGRRRAKHGGYAQPDYRPIDSPGKPEMCSSFLGQAVWNVTGLNRVEGFKFRPHSVD